ncbi:hypothetical protein V5F72_05490 [Xanthobacter flavus]|uniref:hypothetical protein n=1 Tax=Xanthobacter flavus TaxID=281 RepID=UPI0037273F49
MSADAAAHLGQITRRSFVGAAVLAIGAGRAKSALGRPTVRLSVKLDYRGRRVPAPELEAALAEAARSGATVLIDGVVDFAGLLRLPAECSMVGTSFEESILRHDGVGPAIEVTGPCDLDGFTVDGGRTTTDRTRSQPGSLVAIYGPGGRSSARLAGVKIETLRVTNTNCSAALTLANLAGLDAGRLEFESCWGNALLAFGLGQSSSIAEVSAVDVGNTAKSGARQGSAVAIFAERDPNKSPGKWYRPAGEAETADLHFGLVRCRSMTDTGVYVHGYPDGASVARVTFDEVDVSRAGKDGFKIRYHVQQVRAKKVTVSQVALRGVSIEDAQQVMIDSLDISGVGYDIAPDAGLSRVWSEQETLNQSIMAQPGGMLILRSRNVEIPSVKISGVSKSPLSRKYGVGLQVVDSDGVTIKASLSDYQGPALFISNTQGSYIDITSSEAREINKDIVAHSMENASRPTNVLYRNAEFLGRSEYREGADLSGLQVKLKVRN